MAFMIRVKTLHKLTAGWDSCRVASKLQILLVGNYSAHVHRAHRGTGHRAQQNDFTRGFRCYKFRRNGHLPFLLSTRNHGQVPGSIGGGVETVRAMKSSTFSRKVEIGYRR